jgi:prefoldin subunit 4
MGDEKEVRKEDQDRINRFSRLHSKEKLVEEDLKTKQVRTKILHLSETRTN